MIKALLAEKLGMTQIFVDDRAVPVTVLRAGPCHVSQVKTPERDGYSAVQLSFGEIRPTLVTNPQAGHFAKAGVPAARHVTEIPVDDVASVEPGHEVTLGEVFAVGMTADVTGITKGKGYSGVMKRHNFSGQSASHGVHRVHRRGGSIGAASTPSRVFKGMPMAGRLGNDRRTILNLEVVALDLDENLIMLKGPVPGRTGSVVMLRHAVKKGDQGMPEPVVVEPEVPAAETETAADSATETVAAAGVADGATAPDEATESEAAAEAVATDDAAGSEPHRGEEVADG